MRSRSDDYEEEPGTPERDAEHEPDAGQDEDLEHRDSGSTDSAAEGGNGEGEGHTGDADDDADTGNDDAGEADDTGDADNDVDAAADVAQEADDREPDGSGEPGEPEEPDAPEEPEPSQPPGTTPRRLTRRFSQQLIGGAVALSLIILLWATLGTSGPHAVVPTADSNSPTPTAARSTAPPAPKVLAQTIASAYTLPGGPPSLAWPSQGQAAVEVLGMGSLGTRGSTTTPVPIASVTKTMVAYVVLTDHPLSEGESGPSITVTGSEAAAYPAEHALGQSLVLVKAGEQLTERQALEALMLASADNVAKILARWDAGSVDAFVAKMNYYAARLGMAHTRYTDPSGYLPSTVSTAVDQMALGEAAMQNATLAKIAGESSAWVPVQGTIANYNKLLGQEGVTGIKTGSTDQAGGCLLFSATFTVGGKAETVIGALLGQSLGSGDDFLKSTLYVAQRLIKTAEMAVVSSTIAAPGTEVAAIRQAGAADIPLGVTAPVSVVGIAGTTYQVSVSGDPSAATLTVTASVGSSAIASSPLAQIAVPSNGPTLGTLPSDGPTLGTLPSSTPAPSATSAG